MGQTVEGKWNGLRGRNGMADPIRGEIWLADLGTGRGHEQSGQRPVLVVSDDAFNAGLVMTVPLTSKVAKSKNIPAHIGVDPPETGLKTPTLILCDQLRTISKDRLGKAPWGTVSAANLAEVEKALRVLLGL
jgi:mRNA interferase MazF